MTALPDVCICISVALASTVCEHLAQVIHLFFGGKLLYYSFPLTVLSDECVWYLALSRQMFPLLQECMGLIRRLCVEEGGSAELANQLAENLKETTSANKVSADTVLFHPHY